MLLFKLCIIIIDSKHIRFAHFMKVFILSGIWDYNFECFSYIFNHLGKQRLLRIEITFKIPSRSQLKLAVKVWEFWVSLNKANGISSLVSHTCEWESRHTKLEIKAKIHPPQKNALEFSTRRSMTRIFCGRLCIFSFCHYLNSIYIFHLVVQT